MFKSYIKYPNPKTAHANYSYTPVQVAEAYNFPANTTGKGQKIGFIELGGGFSQSDLNQYFHSLGLNPPAVKLVSINGAQNNYADSASGEVMLDLCVALAAASDAQGIIYMADNSDDGFVKACQKMVDDNVNIISISWGAAERQWSAATINKLNTIFQQAQAKGITIFAASGDSGSSDGLSGNNVDFPASSPLVVGCGGTNLKYTGGTVGSEIVWNNGTDGGATGGGISMYFNLPSWQKTTLQTSTRVVPDIAGNADPNSGYKIVVNGQLQVAGGTSAVAPLMAALTARLNEALGKNIGFFLDKAYGFANVFRDITQGNNGTYIARQGPDPCTGMGVPNGEAVLSAFQGLTNSPPPIITPPPTPNPNPTGQDYVVRVTKGVLSVDNFRLIRIN